MGDFAESDYSNEWDDDDIDPDNMTYEVRLKSLQGQPCVSRQDRNENAHISQRHHNSYIVATRWKGIAAFLMSRLAVLYIGM
jgi:hypothetical protein